MNRVETTVTSKYKPQVNGSKQIFFHVNGTRNRDYASCLCSKMLKLESARNETFSAAAEWRLMHLYHLTASIDKLSVHTFERHVNQKYKYQMSNLSNG